MKTLLTTSALLLTMSAPPAEPANDLGISARPTSQFILRAATSTRKGEGDAHASAMNGMTGFDLSWSTIDGGGGTSWGGGFTLSGTIGQPDAGTMFGATYVLAGGFWVGSGDIDPTSPCSGDIDGDGSVDLSDLLAVLAAWGPCPGCPEDIDGNDIVELNDLLAVLAAWGSCEA